MILNIFPELVMKFPQHGVIYLCTRTTRLGNELQRKKIICWFQACFDRTKIIAVIMNVCLIHIQLVLAPLLHASFLSVSEDILRKNLTLILKLLYKLLLGMPIKDLLLAHYSKH